MFWALCPWRVPQKGKIKAKNGLVSTWFWVPWLHKQMLLPVHHDQWQRSAMVTIPPWSSTWASFAAFIEKSDFIRLVASLQKRFEREGVFTPTSSIFPEWDSQPSIASASESRGSRGGDEGFGIKGLGFKSHWDSSTNKICLKICLSTEENEWHLLIRSHYF